MPSPPESTNERLRSALAARGLSVDDLASQLGIAPETVERWIAIGRLPYPRHRRAAADLLGQDEAFLWPKAVPAARSMAVSRSELVSIYPHRSDVPAQLWWSLFAGATDQIAVLVYAGVFLFEQHPDLLDLLTEKTASGCQVRIALGDTTSEAVRLRGEDERFGEGIDSRVRLALRHLEPLRHGSAAEIRLHRTTLYNSIFRFDDQILVNHHIWATNAYEAPVLHLRQLRGGKLFDMFARNFELVWGTAAPVTPGAD